MLNPQSVAHKLLIALLALILGYTCSGCRTRGAVSGKRYDLKGKIVAVDKKGKQLIIAHEAVPDYMEAMTMGFNVKDERVLDEAHPEDTIQAVLIVDGDRSWLDEIVTTRTSRDTSSAQPASSIEPEPGSLVPDFTLVNQDGKRVSLSQYQGRALALTFIYTRCPLPDYCPLMNENFAKIDGELHKDAELYAQTHLLSVTLDPAYDTPELLRKFGAGYTSRPGQQPFAHWEFATGTTEEIKKIAAFFGLQYWEEEGQITHSLRTAIITPEGKLAKLYRGNQWKPEEVLGDFHALKAASLAAPNNLDKIYEANGVVVSVDKEYSLVQIDHEDIKGLMPAMNMPFKVKDVQMLDSIAAGDKVKFSLQATESGLLVVAIDKL